MASSRVFVLIVVTVLLVVFVSNGHAQYCAPTTEMGCLNGLPYNRTTQFPCRDHFYSLASQGCCTEGLVFNSTLSFCCNDGIHNWDQYTCVIGNVTSRTNNRAKRESAPSTSDDALVTPPGFCYAANATHGCLNGVPYNWNTTYPCYENLLDFSTQGCCQGTPYFLSNETCCYDSVVTGSYKVFPYIEACHGQPLPTPSGASSSSSSSFTKGRVVIDLDN